MPAKRRKTEEIPLREWELPNFAPVDSGDASIDAEMSWEVSSEEDCDLDRKGADAGNAFVEFCLEQLYMGKISAKAMCTLCFWASRAGAAGKVKDFALSPNAKSGKFSLHIDKTVGFNPKEDGDLFKLEVPIYAKYDASRGRMKLPMQLPHEVFSTEMETDPDLLDKLETKMAETEWAEAYKEHVVTKSSPRPALPCSLYLDGVAVTHRDGVLGIWVYNLISERRHLCCVIRKSSFCKCGCRGACTLYPVMKTLQWSMSAFAEGSFPSVGPDGVALGGWRGELGGSDLGVVGAFVHIKGDWMEFSTSLGLASWNSKHSPCPFCTIDRQNMYCLSPFNPLTSPWVAVKQEQYEEACAKAERIVTISKEQHKDLVALLHYDRRGGGGRGRCLLQDYGPLGLKKGDRLSPFETMMDVSDFEKVFEAPGKVEHKTCFWRTQEETRSRWRNPLFCAEIGLTTEILAIDLLHTLYLGVAKNFCMATIWHAITNNLYTEAGTTKPERDQLAILAIRNELWAWYKEEKKRTPERSVHKLEDLTLSMIGAEGHKKMNTKAAETKTLVLFCTWLLGKYKTKLATPTAKGLLRIGSSLSFLILTIDGSPRVMTRAQIQTMYDNVKMILAGWEAAGVPLVPKMHLLFHMVERAQTQGNPRFYATFLDESLNRTLRDLVRTSHRNVWVQRIFHRFRWVESKRCKRHRDIRES